MSQETPITGRQCIAARAVLNMDRQFLAERAGVGVETIRRFENGETVRRATERVIRLTLERCGITFIEDGKGITWDPARAAWFVGIEPRET
jgi:transcriptional regulator with XRE-family HTH domain